jgi:hypothetical protein
MPWSLDLDGDSQNELVVRAIRVTETGQVLGLGTSILRWAGDRLDEVVGITCEP